MKISLLLVGKTTDSRLSALVDEYAQRIKRYASFECIIIPELRNARSLSQTEQRKQEGEQILRIVGQDRMILLDERGKEMRSVELAAYVQQILSSSAKRIFFVIGGPYGFSDDVYAHATDRLSLSRLTFSHQMIRLLFTEQLYRAFSILRGEPYHHE